MNILITEKEFHEYRKLKQEKEEQTKTYQKILQEQQNEIDQLERNCDVFNEQMNDAVERATELQQEKKELIEWLKEEIKNADDKSNSISNLTNISYGSRSYALKEILERLG